MTKEQQALLDSVEIHETFEYEGYIYMKTSNGEAALVFSELGLPEEVTGSKH